MTKAGDSRRFMWMNKRALIWLRGEVSIFINEFRKFSLNVIERLPLCVDLRFVMNKCGLTIRHVLQ